MVARSANARAAAGPPGRSASSAPAILKATPLPASRRSGYRESGRCGSTTARAAGMTGGTRWWSVTMTSSPRRPASAISAWLVAPQSTVMMTVAPTACARSSAAIERPWPSSSRLGTYGSTDSPYRSSARTMIASPVRPSASKSPKTSTRSPWSRASARRPRRMSMSGRRAASCSPSSGSPKKASMAAASGTPRATRRPATRSERPCLVAAADASAGTSTRSGSTHLKRGSSTSISLTSVAALRL